MFVKRFCKKYEHSLALPTDHPKSLDFIPPYVIISKMKGDNYASTKYYQDANASRSEVYRGRARIRGLATLTGQEVSE